MSGSHLSDAGLVPLACPHCRHEHMPAVQVVAESARRATGRPVTPEIIHLCPKCGAILILSLHPAPQEAITP